MPDSDVPLKRTLKLKNRKGLHARASAKLAELAATFKAETTVIHKGEEAPADSILNLLMLGASYDTEIILEAQGKDADQALEALTTLIENKFGEDA